MLLYYYDQASTLITWLRSKSQILGLMRDIQERLIDPPGSKPILSVIRPVITRWTAHYLAYDRLLKLRWVLEALVRQDEGQSDPAKRRLTAGERSTAEKGELMINIIKNPIFWESLARYSNVLVANNVLLM